MNKAQIHALFPTAVMSFPLDNPVTELELKTIQGLDYHENHGNRTSDNNHVFDLKALSRLGDFATECLNQYVRSVLAPSTDVQVYVTQSWTNCTKGTEFHHIHDHSNSFLSGVLYVESNKYDKIQFHTPHSQRMFKIPTNEFNQFNSDTWWLPAEKNSIVIFPSWMVHEVPVTRRDTDRISLAFNSFIKGTVGDRNALTELVI